MEHTEGHFSGTDDMQLFYRRWSPGRKSNAVVVLSAGWADNGDRYSNLVTPLLENGYTIYAYDNRGNGHSDGQKGHINSWREYHTDLHNFIKLVQEKEPGKPLFLYGHSMGAMIVAEFVLQHEEGIRGAVLSGIGLEPVGVASPFLIFISRILTKIIPRFSLKLGLDPQAVSHDPEVISAYLADPTWHNKASVRWGTESLDVIKWINKNTAEWNIPVLLIHGEDDKISSSSGSSNFFESIPFTDKELKIYPGMYHEPHNDTDHAKACQDVLNWLDKHI